MKRRGILIWSFDFDSYWIHLAEKMGLTTLGLHPIPDVPAEDPRSLETLLQQMKTESFRSKAKELTQCGIDMEIEIHAMHLLLPREKYAEHPEWFRMDETGVRVCDLNCCPTNEEALAYIEKQAERLAEQIAPYSTSHRYSFWTSDAGKFCHCEKCRELSPSDQALILYNRIIKGIRKVDPQASHCFLAYQNTLQVPEKVKPAEGIFLEYAPIDRDSAFALNDKSCWKNVNQAVHLAPLLEYFGTKGSQVLEYWMDNSRFYQWKHPFGELPFYEGVLKRDVEFYDGFGFESMTSFGCGLNRAYAREYGEYPMLEYGKILQAFSSKE